VTLISPPTIGFEGGEEVNSELVTTAAGGVVAYKLASEEMSF